MSSPPSLPQKQSSPLLRPLVSPYQVGSSGLTQGILPHHRQGSLHGLLQTVHVAHITGPTPYPHVHPASWVHCAPHTSPLNPLPLRLPSFNQLQGWRSPAPFWPLPQPLSSLEMLTNSMDCWRALLPSCLRPSALRT